jgi:HAD superfamily hydrolase (TIGR01490 family)
MAPTSSTPRKSPVKVAAFFDLDLTIISEISGMALVKTAWETGQISYKDILTALRLYLSYKLRFRDPLLIIDEMVGWVKGKSEKSMEELCGLTFSGKLKNTIFHEAEDEILNHRLEGRQVLILSSSLDYICREVCEHLGMDGYICSSLETADGYFTGRPSGRLCFREEKLNRLTGYCNANCIDLSGSWYYSDSISDRSVLEAVEHPVCINPDRELKKLAESRGWKVCRWKVS